MAILVNMGQRGFVLKEGYLAPGKEIVVDSETGETLSNIYKTELKLIKTEELKKEVAQVKEEVKEVKVEKKETKKSEKKK